MLKHEGRLVQRCWAVPRGAPALQRLRCVFHGGVDSPDWSLAAQMCGGRQIASLPTHSSMGRTVHLNHQPAPLTNAPTSCWTAWSILSCIVVDGSCSLLVRPAIHPTFLTVSPPSSKPAGEQRPASVDCKVIVYLADASRPAQWCRCGRGRLSHATTFHRSSHLR